MIYTGYLKTLQDQDTIMNQYLESVHEIDSITNPIKVAEMRRNQEMELGIFTESGDELFQESVKDAVTTLGNKIIEIINRIKDFITGIPQKIKEASWNKADIDKKMQMVKKEDPKRYNDIKVYVDKGMLDFNSFKSMSEFYDNFDKLMDELEKKDADEKSIKAKFNKFKETLVKNKETIATVSAVLGLAATGATIAVNYAKFRNETDRRIDNEVKQISDKADKGIQRARILKEKIESGEAKGHFEQTMLANALVEYEKETKLSVSKLTSLRAYIYNRFDKINIDKYIKRYDMDKNDVSKLSAANAMRATTKLGKEINRLDKVKQNNSSLYLGRSEMRGQIALQRTKKYN